MKRTLVPIFAVLLIATVALAVYPFWDYEASGTSDYNVELDKSRASYQVYASDATVKFSVWRNFGGSWVRLHPAVGDTQCIAFKGVTTRIIDGAKGDVICIDRTDATDVGITAR